MILAPRASVVRKTMRSYWVLAPLALIYLALLAYSWSPDTLSILMPGSLADGFTGGFNPQFFPKLSGIQALFSRPATAASWLAHITAVNAFLGRTIYLDGIATSTPTALSLLVAAVFGPLGLLLHWLTKTLFGGKGGTQVVDGGNGGRITLLPYDK